MPTINDYKKKALNDAGYLGDINVAENKWLKEVCSPYTGPTPALWKYALKLSGYNGNNLVEEQNKMLTALGHTGALPNKWYKYWSTTPLEGVGDPILAIFADGTDGFYFDFSKTDRLFQNLTGTPADGAGENIYLGLESSKWGGRTLAQELAQQSGLVSPGDWIMSAGGTATATESPDGQLNLTGDGTNAALADYQATTVAGGLYQLEFSVAGDSTFVRVGTSQGNSSIVSSTSYAIGSHSVRFFATSTATWVRFNRVVASLCTITSISLKAIPGKHGLQATTSAQPKWQTGGLARFDGSDDNLLTTLVPAAAMSLMFKCKLTSLLAGGVYLTGSRVTGTDSRLYLGFDANEQLHTIVGNTTVTRTGSLHDTLGVAGLVLSGGEATLYWNGTGETPGAVGSPNTTIALPLGAINISAVMQGFFPGDIYHALAIQKALTAAEIAAITNLWGTS